MPKTIVFFILLLCTISAPGQINLVPNPSFEDTSNCPGFQILNTSQPWYTPNLCTPDYYYSIHPTCGNSAFNNQNGYQLPKSGNAYIGLYLASGHTREYIQTQLVQPLLNGETYEVELFISRANLYDLATDAFGIYFSNSILLDSSCFNLSNIPQIVNQAGNLLSDSVNWMQIYGEYTAIGGEQFITIGNFNDSANTWLVDVDNPGEYHSSYYFIDDVSVILKDTTQSVEEISIEFINIFPNPVNDLYLKLDVHTSLLDDLVMDLYDVQGKHINNFLITSPNQVIDIQTLSSGIYIIKFHSRNMISTKYFIKI